MFVYRINSVTHELTIVQSLSSINTKFIDMEINPEQQLLYVLGTTAKDIKVTTELCRFIDSKTQTAKCQAKTLPYRFCNSTTA